MQKRTHPKALLAKVLQCIRPSRPKTPTNPFFKLPPELRITIYELLLKTDEPIDPCSRHGLPVFTCDSELEPQILLVCRQMYHEGRAILYGQNVFSLEFNILYDYYAMWAWTRPIRPETFACLRHLRLNMRNIIQMSGQATPPEGLRATSLTRDSVFRSWRRQQPSTHVYEAVDAYYADVELRVDFERGAAEYSRIKIFDGINVCSRRRPSYPCSELVEAANEGRVLNLPIDYQVAPRPTIQQIGKIIGLFTSGDEDVRAPKFLPRLLVGESVWGDSESLHWQRWKRLLVELDVIEEPHHQRRNRRLPELST